MLPPGALLIHGFTATPECMEPLASPLRKVGFEVELPLIAGHGLTYQELAKTTWEDWYEGIIESFENLQKRTSSVCVAGLSLGGLLSLKLASEFPVKRLALLATPVFLGGLLAKYLLPLIGNTYLKNIYPYQTKWAGPAIKDPAARAAFKSYTKMPIKSIMEIINLQKDIIPRLPTITVPTLILHSPHDTTAPYENLEYLKGHLGSKKIKTVTLENSDHVLTVDYDKEKVFREVVSFFQGEDS